MLPHMRCTTAQSRSMAPGLGTTLVAVDLLLVLHGSAGTA
jgi:hypothetical protein